jgi:Domain of unknown function (DUF4347)
VMLVKGTLRITAITIERGWKLKTMKAKYSTGLGRYAFAIDSPSDMVNKVIAQADDVEDVVQQLNIIGHGSTSGIQIGSHFVEMSNIGDYESDFRRLGQALSGESFVFLRGCAVGQNEPLLVAFAGLCGVPVYAGTSAENVLVDFNFGDIVKAYPGGTVQQGVPRP